MQTKYRVRPFNCGNKSNLLALVILSLIFLLIAQFLNDIDYNCTKEEAINIIVINYEWKQISSYHNSIINFQIALSVLRV